MIFLMGKGDDAEKVLTPMYNFFMLVVSLETDV